LLARAIVLVADRFQPVGRDVHIYCEMSTRRSGGRAVPMFFAGRDHDRVSCFETARRLAPRLNTNPALDDQQPLRSRMRMPVGARTVSELDAIHVHSRR